MKGLGLFEMRHRTPRVAFFPDSFHEVNGVAHTSRNFAAFAGRRGLPFLVVRAGGTGVAERREEGVDVLELPRSRMAISVERDLAFDPLFLRHAGRVGRVLRRFRPEVIHITGPSELGMLGAYFAWRMGVPLAASWHTNVHEYAARRLGAVGRRLPGRVGAVLERRTEAAALWATARFYRLARVLYAPNPELCSLLEGATGRPCRLMPRGVDTALFAPERRVRAEGRADGELVLGYVGRLSVEKNVALLPVVDRALRARGIEARWVIVGQGAEEGVLRRELAGEGLGAGAGEKPSGGSGRAEFRGVLRGEALARAYADMDLLVFPSHTDTFGNVVLEALASGVPAAVTPDGGPRFIVADGVTGVVAGDAEFAEAIAELVEAPERMAAMRLAARAYALGCSWDSVFEGVYAGYEGLVGE